ncbi:hypothetical protein ACHMW5_02465 [Azospirillum melinis]|uniref:hypothetical protein n=1 Tax=Azospirillum melinis TaxID=328839 RepID=UPI0037576085
MTTPDQRRMALIQWVEHLKQGGVISSRSNWCAQATASESAVREFIKGGTDSLNESTYKKLSVIAGVTPDDLRLPPSNSALRESDADDTQESSLLDDLEVIGAHDPDERANYEAMIRNRAAAVRARRQRDSE